MMQTISTSACAILLCLIVGISAQKWTEEQQQRIRKYRSDCIAETKVTPELIDRADKGDFVDDANLKCFAKCFYQKAGFIDEKGELLLDAIKTKIPAEADKDKVLAVIEKCKQEKGVDACETAYLIHKCYFQNSPHPDVGKEEEKKP